MAQNSFLAKKESAIIESKTEFMAKQATEAVSAIPIQNTPSDYRASKRTDGQKDYFVEKDGVVFAGSHILVDLWGARNLDDQDVIERALRTAAAACGATLLHIHLHRFTDSGGVSGVAVLAESHISVHTWPERDFAAFDVFMCGKCDPTDALPVLRDFFAPTDMQIDSNRRGMVR
jgi:S-adenosylmethionine decarboxylase